MLNKKSILIAAAGILSFSCYASNTLNLRLYNHTQNSLVYQSFLASGCTATTNSSAFQHQIEPGQSALIPINLINGPYLGGSLNFIDAKTGAVVTETILDPSIVYTGTASFESPSAGYSSSTLAEEYYSKGSSNHMEVPYANISIQ